MDEEDQSASKGSGSVTDASTCVSGRPQEAGIDGQAAGRAPGEGPGLFDFPCVVAGCW